MHHKIYKLAFLICLILIFSSRATAQYKFGVQGGMGISDYTGADHPTTIDRKSGITAGLFFEREINLTLSFGVELTHDQKGTFYKFSPREATQVKVDSRMEYISLPVLMKAYFGKRATFYIYTGLTGSYMRNSQLSFSTTEYGYEISSDPFFKYKLNQWDASLLAGFGFNVYEIILDIRYHHGVVSVYEGKNAPNIRNHFLSATLGFSIFKKKDNRCFINGF